MGGAAAEWGVLVEFGLGSLATKGKWLGLGFVTSHYT